MSLVALKFPTEKGFRQSLTCSKVVLGAMKIFSDSDTCSQKSVEQITIRFLTELMHQFQLDEQTTPTLEWVSIIIGVKKEAKKFSSNCALRRAAPLPPSTTSYVVPF